jgi:2-methylcitrate dehydratase PrpD
MMRTKFMLYGLGYFMQTPISAMLDLIDRHDIEPARIEMIDIKTS